MDSESLAMACFAAAGAIGVGLAYCALSDWRLQRQTAARVLAPERPAPGVAIAGHQCGWLRVLDAPALVATCKLAPTLQQIQRESKLASPTWTRDIAPAIARYLEFVQLMPASEAHHHAHVGGLAAHTIEVVSAALRLRNGMLLPSGCSAEEIDAQRDHWSYAAILAALLHDVGKPMADLRIELIERAGGPARRWLPITGDLGAAGACEYRVGFAPKAERDYGAHRRLPLVLMQRIVPPSTMAFLGREPAVMAQLMALLSGDGAAAGALHELVRQADQASTRSNLLQGPRNRFVTATAVPLVERLNQALRQLLADGRLPLNRDGAAGWVSGSSVWFVAKRLADTVREEILRSDPDATDSVPGANKNDRLFDAWQDYAVLEPHPETGQAIWYVRVDGAGYSHEFAVLKFPLAKLYELESLYPSSFQGSVTILPGRNPASAETPEPAAATDAAPAKDEKSTARRRKAGAGIPAPKPAHEATTVGKPAETATTSAPEIPSSPDAGEDLLDEDDTATVEERRVRKTRGTVRPVVPFVEVPPLPGDAEPGGIALEFMTWLQRGVGDGSIKYNEAGAMVHFVALGMLLISPRVFREFAALSVDGDDGAAAAIEKQGGVVQREVLRARWHLVGAGRTNIHAFAVLKRGGVKAGKLAAVVIEHPERWFNPVPPTNPCIQALASVETA